MKNLLVLAITFIAFGTFAQTIKTPAPSPGQTIKQDFALSSIEVNYSRPAAKGRKIFGDLVPYGKLWRTGANAQTIITFGEDVTVGGKALKAGKYSLITIPNKSEWEIIFCKPETSASNYSAENEVMRFKAKVNEMPMAIENFMIVFGAQISNSVMMSIIWEKTEVEFEVKADIDTKIMAEIDKAMNVDSKPYFQAAGYYFDNGKDLTKALAWADKAVEAQPTAYWVATLKARIQAKAGDKKGATATAMKALQLAKDGKNDDYVKINEELIKSLK
jgi:tetratricopeptide (TPR) repeat protein